MNNRALRLNEAKTGFIIFKPLITDVSNFKLKDGTSLVHSSNQVKVLGVTIESKITLDPQISTSCLSTYMQIRKINCIRNFLTTNAVKTLVQSTVIVCLDNCYSLHRGLPMNSSARLITLTPRFEHISLILKQLHWLPIRKRCQFKFYYLFTELYIHQHQYTNANC